MVKIKVTNAFFNYGGLYKDGDVLTVGYFTEDGCWALNENMNNLFLLKHEYEILEESK